MKKKLNIEAITSELQESAFFPRPARVQPEEINPSPLPEKPIFQEQQPFMNAPERPFARTGERQNGKRIITRNAFEIYEDQMASLRKLSLQEKMEGKLGSMSHMVRQAIDAYLKEKSPTK